MSKSGKKNIQKKDDIKQETGTPDVENTGNYLRTLRLGKGLSIKDVTEATRISETNLNAIEDQDFSSLPANTFTRGLLNIYSDFLGADTEAVVAKFMQEREDKAAQKRRTRHKYTRKILTPKRLAEPSQVSSMTMAGILLLVIIVTFTGYCVYTSWNPFGILMNKNGDIQSVMKNVFPDEKSIPNSTTKEEIIIVPANQAPAISTTESQPDEDTENISPAAPEESASVSEELPVEQTDNVHAVKYLITLSFLKDTSIELTKDDDETVVLEFEAGVLESLSADSSMTLTFSQPESAEILVNDQPVSFPEALDGNYTLHIPQDIAKHQPDE